MTTPYDANPYSECFKEVFYLRSFLDAVCSYSTQTLC